MAVNLQFPIHDNDMFPSRVTFEVVESTPPEFKADFTSFANLTEEGRKDLKPIATVSNAVVQGTGNKVSLYIPQANQVAEVFQYDTPGLGMAGAAGVAALDAGGSVNSAISSALDQGFKGMSDLIGAFRGEALGRLAVVRAANFVPSQTAREVASITARTTVHPNMRTMFKSVAIRKFQFLFKFIPNSAREAKEVKDIINFFRYYAYPEEIPASLAGNSNISIPVGYKYPNMFRIRMQTKNGTTGKFERHGVKIIDSYIESINTNFNPQVAIYHENGEPIETDLSINFIEHRALGRGDIDRPSGAYTDYATFDEGDLG